MMTKPTTYAEAIALMEQLEEEYAKTASAYRFLWSRKKTAAVKREIAAMEPRMEAEAAACRAARDAAATLYGREERAARVAARKAAQPVQLEMFA